MTIKMDDLKKALESINNPILPITPFEGRNDKRTFQDFVREFNRAATACSYTTDKCARVLPAYLSSHAAATYDTLALEIKKDWLKLLDELAKRFAIPGGSSAARALLYSKRQKNHESVAEYAKFVKETTERAYPESQDFTKEMREKLSVDIFFANLKFSLRQHLARQKHPDTFKEAVDIAVAEENLQYELEEEAEKVNFFHQRQQYEDEQYENEDDEGYDNPEYDWQEEYDNDYYDNEDEEYNDNFNWQDDGNDEYQDKNELEEADDQWYWYGDQEGFNDNNYDDTNNYQY